MRQDSDEQRFRGYAGIIRNTLSALNDDTRYRSRHGSGTWRFVCTSPHWRYAALIAMEKGSLRVDAVANLPRANVGKAALGWDGFVEMDGGLFTALITGRLSFFGVMRKWLAGRVTLKGPFKLIILWDVFHLLKKARPHEPSCRSVPLRDVPPRRTVEPEKG